MCNKLRECTLKGQFFQSWNHNEGYWFEKRTCIFKKGGLQGYWEFFHKTSFLSFLRPEVSKKHFFSNLIFRKYFFSLSKFFIFHFLDFYLRKSIFLSKNPKNGKWKILKVKKNIFEKSDSKKNVFWKLQVSKSSKTKFCGKTLNILASRLFWKCMSASRTNILHYGFNFEKTDL